MKRSFVAFASIFIAATLSGCGMNPALPLPADSPSLKGNVHGGNQPVVGATIQLYAAGTADYASPAQPLIAKSVLTDSAGNFDITGDFTCPALSTPDTQVYITATGGNPGLDGDPNNTALALMTALGSCRALTSSTAIEINELTTVAAVWSLAQFMSGYANIGVTPTNYTGLQNAFFTSSQLVNFNGVAMPSTTNTTTPTAELHTLANILAACVNSSGDTTTPTTPCSKLFAATKPTAGTAATNTIGAALSIALNPLSNVANLFALSSANAPFQPALTTAPPDWTVGILTWTNSYTKYPSGGVVDSDNNYWETSFYFTPAVAVSGPSPMYTETDDFFFGAGSPAFGLGGRLYMLHADNQLGYGGRTASTQFTGQQGGGITSSSGPESLSIAPNGNLWMPLFNGALAEFSPPSTPVSPSTGFTGLLTANPDSSFASVFDSSGFLYVLDSDTVIHKIDTNPATPTVTTYSGGGIYFPGSPAIDHAGDLWVLNAFHGFDVTCCVTVSAFGPTGAPLLATPYTPGDFNTNNMVIDGRGKIWLAFVNDTNQNPAGVAVFDPQSIPAPATILGSAFIVPGPPSAEGNSEPSTRYLALDQSGNVWTTVYGESSTFFYNPTLELIGLASPVATPLSIAVKNNTLGTRP